MKRIYKSAEGERAVRERYLEILKRWPVANQQFRVPTREGETFVIASGADAHALWLDDVMQALSLTRVSMVGVSLGGWLALDYATRWPERVESLVVLCPGGVGQQKMSIVFKMVALRMLGAWGSRKLREMIFGRAPENPSPAIRYFTKFVLLIHDNFRPRSVKLPIFGDDTLKRLTMPVMAILGGKDVLLNSTETKQRLERHVRGVEIRYIPEARHYIPGQTEPILDFLRKVLVLA